MSEDIELEIENESEDVEEQQNAPIPEAIFNQLNQVRNTTLDPSQGNNQAFFG